MDWYFDIAVLLGTFCVIALGMTIYARLNPTRPRVRRSHYIYTGIIPTITISSADSPTKRSPTTLTPADSVEEDEHKSNNSESPVDDAERARQAQNNHLSIPVSDDEDDDEGEQQQTVQSEDTSVPISFPPVDNAEENKNKSQDINLTSLVENVKKDEDHSHVTSLVATPNENARKNKDNSQTVSLPQTPVGNVVEQDKDSSQAISLAAALDAKETEQQSMTSLLFDKSDEEDHSQTESLSAVDNIEDDHSQGMDLSDFDDLSWSPILNKTDNSSEADTNDIPATNPSVTNNKSLGKIGTSHTVEEPLFPFSEILEEENPSVRNRFKKRLSQ